MPRHDPSAQSLTLRCPAKVNLTLAVAPPREDGLHPIASVMVAIDFGDDLTLQRLGADSPSTFDRRFAEDAPRPEPIDWPIESDLIYRAHRQFQEAAGRTLPVACTLNKRIPTGAGFGGGSGNAAGMLIGLRELFTLDVSDEQLATLAASLGADVVFAVHAMFGQPVALVTGIGEIITPITSLPSFNCVLVFPEGKCPTPAVYRAFDQQHARATKPIDDAHIASWRTATALPPPHNDLTKAALTVCPAIRNAIDAVREHGHEPRLTGSGAGLFILTATHEQAHTLAARLNNNGVSARAASY